MINAINPSMQTAVQSMSRPEEQREMRQEPPRMERAEYASPAVKVSLQQTAAQNPGQKAMQDYRALGQKAVLAVGQSTSMDTQNNMVQAQQQMRNQAYLATAALKTGGY